MKNFLHAGTYALKLEDFGQGGVKITQNDQKKWCFLTSVAKRVLGIIKRLLEYDIEYNGTPSGNYRAVSKKKNTTENVKY